MSSDGSVFTSDKFFVQDISCTIQLQVHHKSKKTVGRNVIEKQEEEEQDEEIER